VILSLSLLSRPLSSLLSRRENAKISAVMQGREGREREREDLSTAIRDRTLPDRPFPREHALDLKRGYEACLSPEPSE